MNIFFYSIEQKLSNLFFSLDHESNADDKIKFDHKFDLIKLILFDLFFEYYIRKKIWSSI